METIADLVHQVRQGNQEAMAELVRRYRGLVFSVCFERTGNWHDSEDLTQEVFVTAYQGMSSVNDPSRFPQWLCGVAANLCKMHLRKKARRQRLPAAEQPESQEGTRTRRLFDLQDLVGQALREMTTASREVLCLHYFGGYSYAEISALCDLPEKTVKSRLHEARQQLKARLLKFVAEMCQCRRETEHTVRCVMERCGRDVCQCVELLQAE